MKRLLVAALVLSMLGSSAVVAAPYGRDNHGYTRGYNNNGAAMAGLGIFALAAILASQNNHHYGYDQYNRGYEGGYHQGYGRYDNDRDGRGYDQNRNGYPSGYGNRGHW